MKKELINDEYEVIRPSVYDKESSYTYNLNNEIWC